MKKKSNLDIREFEPGQTITGFFAVRKKELRTKKDGDPYLFLELGDKTGRIPATVWETPEKVDQKIKVGSIVKIQGKIVAYQDHLQITVDKARPAAPSDGISPEDLLPACSREASELWKETDALIASIRETPLKRLLEKVFGNKTFRKRFEHAPGGKLWHHAYLGGLLEHTLGVAQLCDRAAQQDRELHRDLLIAAALLHDIGKIESYGTDGFIDYTDVGRLWGHIVIGAQNVRTLIEQMDQKEPFPEEIKKQLIHLLLSHQGALEHGSPVVPMTPEALVLYYMDELDSKLNAFKHVRERDRDSERGWSRYVPVMERFFYFGEKENPDRM